MAESNILPGRGGEVVFRIGFVVLLIVGTFLIVQPFIGIIAWAIVMAVAMYPTFERIRTLLGGRPKSAAALLTAAFLVVFIGPAFALSETLVSGVRDLAHDLQAGTVTIPMPSASVHGWPVIGEKVAEVWTLAATNIDAAVLQFREELAAVGRWLLRQAATTGLGLLQFIAAVILSGFLLGTSARGSVLGRRIAQRVIGPNGERLAALAVATTRSVARGVLGVALIQATMAGIGMLAIGIPGAGLWALVVLLLCVVQIGPALVMIPAAIYVFSAHATLPATLFAIWSVLVLVIDNVLKPMLLGRGVDVPMLVVVVGAIGGLIAMGVIGLFVGAIVLVVAYAALVGWLEHDAVA